MNAAPLKTIPIVQGEHAVSADPATVFSTVLGSCVAVCLHDAMTAVGGMNHFLLPGDDASRRGRDVERYGVQLMEVLINDLMKLGARRERLQAKVFGGAKIVRGLGNVGAANAEFARTFLSHEGIRIVAADLGGARARRVQFWPVSGRARQIYVAPEPRLAAAEAARAGAIAAGGAAGGDMELF
jgi:chemotaxis protein CheD